jgi:predicted dehydrogenase
MAHFERVIRGEVTPLVGVLDGLRNLAVTEAICEAAASGTRVVLAP